MSDFDGLLSQERDDIVQRVTCLENKVQQQEDEIICLKSAMADIVRRFSFTNSTCNLLPLKSTPRSQLVRRSFQASTRSRPQSAILENSTTLNQKGLTNQSVSLRQSFSPVLVHSHQKKKSSSLSNSSEMTKSQLTLNSSKDPVWSAGDSILRFYIKGKVINLQAPFSMNDYDALENGELPVEKLQLEWVYGYRGRDSRCNLFHLPTGELIYFAAAVVVLYNVEENTQRHYLGHNDDVKCLAVHPDMIRVATGQVAGHDRKEGKPHVRIWDSVSLNTLHVVGLNDFDRAVCCLSFSTLDSGQYLVVVDDSNEHTMSLWDVGRDQSPHKVTETKSSTEPVLALEFHPSEKHSIVSCGKGHITFWSFEGGTLSKKQGIYDKYDKPKYVLCFTFSPDGDVLTGDSNGNILVWPRGCNRIGQAVLGGHDGGIFSLLWTKEGNLLSGGGKDRRLVEWDSTLTKTGREVLLPELYGPVRMLANGNGGLIVIGTTRNNILQGSLDLDFSPIMQGHVDELWGVASHPTQHQFLTCSDDHHVFLWDSQSRSAVWCKELNNGAHCCCFHPDGGVVAIGTKAARWFVIDLATHEIVSVHTEGIEQLECVQYSPNGEYIAIGSRDNSIYVYLVGEAGHKYSRVGRCSGHSSFVTQIDWSTESKYLASNSGDYELLFWSASSCKQVTDSLIVRDIQWATQSCTIGFCSAGIWQEGADGTDVNSCNRNHKGTLLATADDFGKVNLYQYPCVHPQSPRRSFRAHSSHVTNVSFLYDDSRLVSCGGRDMTVMQWQIV